VELKLPPPLKSVTALRLRNASGQRVHLYIHISENNMLRMLRGICFTSL